jgi:hypothetical protein
VRRSPQRVQLSWSTSGRDRTYEANTLFTGYLPARMRGEMQAYQVLGAP